MLDAWLHGEVPDNVMADWCAEVGRPFPLVPPAIHRCRRETAETRGTGNRGRRSVGHSLSNGLHPASISNADLARNRRRAALRDVDEPEFDDWEAFEIGRHVAVSSSRLLGAAVQHDTALSGSRTRHNPTA